LAPIIRPILIEDDEGTVRGQVIEHPVDGLGLLPGRQLLDQVVREDQVVLGRTCELICSDIENITHMDLGFDGRRGESRLRDAEHRR
jgi:hypothetical protein